METGEIIEASKDLKIWIVEAKLLQLGEHWRPFKSNKKGWYRIESLVDLDPDGKGKHPLFKNKMAVYSGKREFVLDKNQNVYINVEERQKRAKS